MKNHDKKIFLGVMSGTSLDAVDVVAVCFEPQVTLLAAQSFTMPDAIRQSVLTLCTSGDDEIEKLGHLDISLGKLFSQCCNSLIDNNPLLLSREKISAIGLHGQTIRHRPDNYPNNNFSLQIGDANTVAENTNILTIADFRSRDLAAGGQGAPLVPAFHRSCFACNKANRVIINIGGMSNITLLAKDKDAALIGFDTGPGNVLMDAWIQQHQGLNYDNGGQWASEGKTHYPLLVQLLSLNFFSQQAPKSTGREQFSLVWLQKNIDALKEKIKPADIQATRLELTAVSIVDEIKKYQFDSSEVYICGGGAHNRFLMHRLNQLLPLSSIVTSTIDLSLNPDWVEAIAFAWLAKQTLTGLTGNSSSVTGARGERILGAIYQA
jgi:anhydro-N-acetylmuramic acid kinase